MRNLFGLGLIVFVMILFYFAHDYNTRTEKTVIDGHEYFMKHYYHDVELIHSDECLKCRKQLWN